jgi:tRNA pseudouridine38-40 synthase
VTRRRIRIDLAYDGTDFAGWQVQPGLRTVQGVVEQALTRLDGDRPVRLHGAGRTDAGVHARGQVAHCDLSTAEEDAELRRALSRILPGDVRPLALSSVAANFDVRRDALEKHYRYRIDRSQAGDPFTLRYVLHHPQPLDVDRMRVALALLPGRRDWSGFAAAACTVQDRVRTLTRAEFDGIDDGEAAFDFRGDGFLTHMVRNLVGTLLEVGRGKMAPERVVEILEAGDRKLAGPTAPPQGLCLERVVYGDERGDPS